MSHFTNYCEIIPQHRKDVPYGREDAWGMIIQETVQQLRDGSHTVFIVLLVGSKLYNVIFCFTMVLTSFI